jgi:hypothetical protein
LIATNGINGAMRAYRTVMNPPRSMRSCHASIRAPDSSSKAARPPRREIEKAVTAASVAAVIVSGVPSAVPKSNPLAAASSCPGKNAHDRAADTRMKMGGAHPPVSSTKWRTRSGECEIVTSASTAIAATPRATSASRSRGLTPGRG